MNKREFMNYKESPKVIHQTIVHEPIEKVFHLLINPKLVPLLWFAEIDKPLKEGEVVKWKWAITETSLKIFIKKMIPNKLLSTVWQDTFVTVDYELNAVTDKITLLTFKASNFKETEKRLIQAMEDKRSIFMLVSNTLKMYLTSQKEKEYAMDNFYSSIVKA